jgi:hypothetical protein
MRSNPGRVYGNKWLIIVFFSWTARKPTEVTATMADPWGELMLELWWSVRGVVFSYKTVKSWGICFTYHEEAAGYDEG